MAKSRKRRTGIWLLVWIIIFLALIILILLNEKKPEDQKKNFKKEIAKQINNIKDFISSKTESTQIQKESSTVTQKNALKKIFQQQQILKKSETLKKEVKIYFVKYLEDMDKLKLVYVTRTISYNEEPLKEAIKLLIKGPNPEEESAGITSAFPSGVKLLDLDVQNGVAYINFNSAFESGVGVPVLQARLYQVVYTATQFPKIKAVRFLIEGELKNTFSTEGLSIKYPLQRLDKEPLF